MSTTLSTPLPSTTTITTPSPISPSKWLLLLVSKQLNETKLVPVPDWGPNQTDEQPYQLWLLFLGILIGLLIASLLMYCLQFIRACRKRSQSESNPELGIQAPILQDARRVPGDDFVDLGRSIKHSIARKHHKHHAKPSPWGARTARSDLGDLDSPAKLLPIGVAEPATPRSALTDSPLSPLKAQIETVSQTPNSMDPKITFDDHSNALVVKDPSTASSNSQSPSLSKNINKAIVESMLRSRGRSGSHKHSKKPAQSGHSNQSGQPSGSKKMTSTNKASIKKAGPGPSGRARSQSGQLEKRLAKLAKEQLLSKRFM